MATQNHKSPCSCETKSISEINSKISLCFSCSSVIFKDESGIEITTIKPSTYSKGQESAIPLFLSIPDNYKQYSFRNKADYLKIRSSFVKQIKSFCYNFNLSKKTYFLSLDYFDRICSKMPCFDIQDLLQICKFCILLASKFHEPQIKYLEIKSNLFLSNNYSKDELYLLQVLDYDLLIHTSYDILIDIMHTGFLFENEKFSLQKMNILYEKMENMLYFFSETKYYIDMTNKEIALCFIGLSREILGLIPYNNILKSTFMNEQIDAQKYYCSLKKLKKCIKIKSAEKTENPGPSNSSENKK